MQNIIYSYQLSYYKTGEPSSLDILIDTKGENINGFQLALDIEASPQIDIIDQDDSTEGLQLDISSTKQLNFLNNQIRLSKKGHRIELAAITSSPTEPISFSKPTPIAKLLFSQSKTGQVNIIQDSEFTKTSTITENTSSPKQDTTISSTVTPIIIKTQPVGDKITKLEGEMFIAPEQITETITPTPTPTPTPTSQKISLIPIIIILVSIILGIALSIFLIKKFKRENDKSLPSDFPETPPQMPKLSN